VFLGIGIREISRTSGSLDTAPFADLASYQVGNPRDGVRAGGAGI